MVNETQVRAIETMLNRLLADEPAYFLVEVKLTPGNNIKVSLDGDSGISIEKCVQYSRSLYKQIEEAGLFTGGDFSLEVSSPGLDEPLRLMRQYTKNIGRPVEIVLNDGSKKEGRLTDVSADGIIIEETKGQKQKKGIDYPYFFIY